MSAPLKPALPLFEGETLTGYVSRSAKLYETTVRDFCSDLGVRWPYLCSGHDDQFERLAWLLGKSPEKLRVFTSGKVEVGRFKFGETVATFGALRRTAARFCPRCVIKALSENGPHGVFQLHEWAVTSLYACLIHECALMTLPPSSHAHIAYDFVSRVLDQIDAIKEASNCPDRILQTSFERYIRRRIWQGPQDDWLKDLDLTQIHRLCLNLGAAVKGLTVKAMMALSGEQERSLCQLGFEYFEAGPDEFKVALQRLHEQSSTERPYFSSDMGPFYQWLREFYDDPVLAPVVDLTCSHIFATYPMPTGKEVFGRFTPKQTLLTMNEARKKMGVTAVFLRKLLGHMNGINEAESNLRSDVHVEELTKVQNYWESLVNLETAASLLTISSDQVKLLQECGVLDTIKITSSLRYVSRAQVVRLLDKLQDLPAIPPRKSVAPLREFCRSKQVSIVRMIELWVEGKLEGMLYRGEGHGLRAIEVDWSLLFDKEMMKLIDDLELTDVARYLMININGIRRLRDAGLLDVRTQRNPDTKHLKQYVTQRSISCFEQQYITLGQMAYNQNVRPIHLARKLDRENVSPISCRAGHVRVYSRQEVKGMGF